MSEFNFEINGGESIRLKTAGKYCDRDIVVEGKGGGGRNPLELLYTEGAEITPEDWGNINFVGESTTQAIYISGTRNKTIAFPDTQICPIALSYNKNLEEYHSGANMLAGGNYSDSYSMAQCFRGCSNLKILTMNNEGFLPFGRYSFTNCTSLKEIRYKGSLDAWASAYRYDTSAYPFVSSGGGSFYLGDSENPLTEIELTNAETINNGAFYKFIDVDKAVIGETVETIKANAFSGCANLETLILKGDTVKTLSALTALGNTPIVQRDGTIWIQPETVDEDTLVAEYKAATNWSTLETQIKPFSEYTGG